MLYPFWIWLWTQALGLLGLKAIDWVAFMHQSQALNALAAAITIGLLFSVLESIAGTGFALLGAVQFGLSTAVILHATNSAEPVMGLLFSVASVRVVLWSLNVDSKVGLLFTGLLLALTLASYQAMALIAPSVAFACICWPNLTGSFQWRQAMLRLSLVGAGGLISVAVIYAWAYSSLGVPWNRMVTTFFRLDGGADVYGGFSASNLVNIPLGLVRNLYFGVPEDYGGIRSLLRHTHRAQWILGVLCSLFLIAAFGCVVAKGIISAVRKWDIPKPLVCAGILLSVLGVTIPLILWSPTYDKLWLLPLVLLIISGALAFRFGGFSAALRTNLVAGIAGVILLEGALNLPRAITDHFRETAHITEARELAALAGPATPVVVDFDDVSMLWLNIWGTNADKIALPAVKRAQAMDWLARARDNQARLHGKLLFVGVLDHDRKSWDAFLGRATQIGFDEFDCYRREAVIIRRYPFSTGPVTVRELDFPSDCFAGADW